MNSKCSILPDNFGYKASLIKNLIYYSEEHDATWTSDLLQDNDAQIECTSPTSSKYESDDEGAGSSS